MHAKTKQLVMAALMASMVCVATMIVKIPSPMKGYINLGDCIVLLCGWVLGPVYAFMAAGIGSALADIFSGYALYAPATFVIKGLMALLFSCKAKKIITARNLVMLIPAALISIAGYYLYEGLITGNFVAALAGISGSAGQAVASSIVFVAAGLAMDKYNLKKKLLEDYK